MTETGASVLDRLPETGSTIVGCSWGAPPILPIVAWTSFSRWAVSAWSRMTLVWRYALLFLVYLVYIRCFTLFKPIKWPAASFTFFLTPSLPLLSKTQFEVRSPVYQNYPFIVLTAPSIENFHPLVTYYYVRHRPPILHRQDRFHEGMFLKIICLAPWLYLPRLCTQPDSQKGMMEKTGDKLSGTMDSVASTLQPEVNFSFLPIIHSY